MMEIRRPGQGATKSQQLLLSSLIVKRSPEEVIVVHHVTQDTQYKLQLEIERRCPVNGPAFERVVL